MSIIDQLLAVLAPYECLSCTAEGSLLCTACIQQLTNVPDRCYRCCQPSAGALTCAACRSASNIYRVQAGTAYSGAAKDLVWQFKSAGAQAAARLMATRLRSQISTASGTLIIPVPTATNRVRGRGYDQAKLLARELSGQSRLPYVDCLVRTGRTHQVGASRQQRLSQLQGVFRVTNPEKIQGARVLLIDDVITTGATLESATEVLRIAGSGQVEAAVFCAA